ncbi:hypothetical protein [Shimazuella kribbensis]|uniref:hypothetical protein n=1 Tax=Shimazuella kribbensis TaxID=139808 RepID=UPI0003FC45B8|nr:hypothetical protein [Shimazuella kribbensis]
MYFTASKSDLDRLFACNRESALVWNECLQQSQQFELHHKKWISKSELQRAMKGQFHFHSQSIQAVCHKYLFARDSARQAIRQGIKTARYSYKNKNHYHTKWAKDGIRIHANGKIELSMGIHGGKREKPISIHTKHLPQGQIKEIELCYDHRLYLSVALRMEEKNKHMKRNRLREWIWVKFIALLLSVRVEKL